MPRQRVAPPRASLTCEAGSAWAACVRDYNVQAQANDWEVMKDEKKARRALIAWGTRRRRTAAKAADAAKAGDVNESAS